MTEDEKIKHLIKIARIRFNFSLTLIALTILTMVYIEYPVNNKAPIAKGIVNDTIMDNDIDSSEIKDGIHVPSGLIADKGFDLVLNNCQRCHSIAVVKQNRATKDGWKNMITWMQKTQGLWDLGPNEEPILEYLSKNYAPVNSGRRKNLENIVWYKLN